MSEFDRVAVVWTGPAEQCPSRGRVMRGVMSSKNLPAVLDCAVLCWQGEDVPDLHDYDLFLVYQFAIGERHISQIKRARPDAVVISMIDPPPEHVFYPPLFGDRQQLMLEQVALADYIGARTPSQIDAGVYAALLGREDRVVSVPVPVGPVEAFEALHALPKEDYILSLDHSWAPSYSAPNLAVLRQVQDATGLPIKYLRAQPHTKALASALGLRVEWLESQSPDVVSRLTAQARFAVDVYPMHSIGRFEITAALCKTICFGSTTTQAINFAYECDPWTLVEKDQGQVGLESAIGWLLSDREAYRDFVEHAYKRTVALHDFEAARKQVRRLMELPVRAFDYFPGPSEIAALNTAQALDVFWASDFARNDYYQHPARQAIFDGVLDWPVVTDRLAGAQDVADIGCGPGMFLAQLHDHFPRANLYGLDYAKSAIQQARERIPWAALRCHDLMTFNGSEWSAAWDGAMQVAFALEVLEHQDDPDAFIHRLLRMVRPGGLLVLSVPNGATDTWNGHKQRWTFDQFAEFLAPFGTITVRGVPGTDHLMAVIEKAVTA